MASYWPTPMAMKNDPVVAEGMNSLPKVVFSRTLDKASWNNTRLVKGDMRDGNTEDEGGARTRAWSIMGSGTIVAQLARGARSSTSTRSW